MKIKIRDFKKAYLKAVEKRDTQFKVDGKVFVTPFAKYLLEHLWNMGKKDKDYIEFNKPAKQMLCRECGYIKSKNYDTCPQCKTKLEEHDGSEEY